jgi:hypothetical protein
LKRAPSLETRSGLTIIVIVFIVLIIVSIRAGVALPDISDFASVVIPMVSLLALLIIHNELMGEQTRLRRLQSRPQVIAYFERRIDLRGGRDEIVVIIKHFGGGPALDVRFRFDPPLRNHDGETFEATIPFSTGIAVMPPHESQEVKFADYAPFYEQAGFERLGIGGDEDKMDIPLEFQATISLRDPIGDDQVYTSSYTMDLAHLMPYTMVERPEAVA